MSISGIDISASGMMDAQIRMDAAANNIANVNSEPPVYLNDVSSQSQPNGQGVSTYVRSRESTFGTDLSSEFVNMKLAQNSFEANAKAAQIASQSIGSLLDMVDTDQDRN